MRYFLGALRTNEVAVAPLPEGNRMQRAKTSLVIFALSWTMLAHRADGQQPLAASLVTAPDRDYDLMHVSLDLVIDYEHRAFHGMVTNTLAPLRDGLQVVRFHANRVLTIDGCDVAGGRAVCAIRGDLLEVTSSAPLSKGKPVAVRVRYRRTAASDRGLFWIEATPGNRDKEGFFTTGQIDGRRFWLPTWDYPNDFATSETRTTVPADWYVVGNGRLISDALADGGRSRTYHWKMDDPHATYLISLAGGKLDVKTARWGDVPLLYIVPKGKAALIEPTFGETPNMMAFFTQITGVKYPWPKYSQTAMYDYGGGHEWVSATTIGEASLTNPRRGFRTSSGLVAHELAHQWFGNLVTCRSWGDIWLNEGFATFMAVLYGEHARSEALYQQNIDGNLQTYIGESRRVKRPLASIQYDPGAVFDAQSYARGAVVLHMLRRRLGDAAFFAGVRHYLTTYAHRPVDSHDLERALTDATGVNLAPFFDEWVYRPGHPVLTYSWRWDQGRKEVVVTVRQTQDSSLARPIYTLGMKLGLIEAGKVSRVDIMVERVEQEFRIPRSSRPDAVVLDPDHDVLREMAPAPWAPEELPHVLRYAPNAVDRETALGQLSSGEPSTETVRDVVEVLRADTGQFPVFRSIARLGDLRREGLRPFFREQLRHRSSERRAQAVRALGKLAPSESDVDAVRRMVDSGQTYAVVRAATQALRDWDARGNQDFFRRVLNVVPERDLARLVAYDALAKAAMDAGQPLADPSPETTRLISAVLVDIANADSNSRRMTPAYRNYVIPLGSADVKNWLADMKSLTFLAREDVGRAGMARRGVMVTRIWHGKLVTSHRTVFLSFYLSEDGRAADLDFYFE